MTNEAIQTLITDACASIKYRVRKEILEEDPDIAEYLDEILEDKRVQYVFTWQKDDGYLGQSFHGGWIPKVQSKYFSTGAEAALRFLSEMALPKNHPVVEKGLKALLGDDWNIDFMNYAKIVNPNTGMLWANQIRAVVFAYFGIEEHDFTGPEIKESLRITGGVSEISSLEDITGMSRDKLYYNTDTCLPSIYDIKLLAFTHSWRNSQNTGSLAKGIERLIDFSPVPEIYIPMGNSLAAPAQIAPNDLTRTPRRLRPDEWYWWLHTMELFARMGIASRVAVLRQHVSELKEMLAEGDGFFPVKPPNLAFTKWSTYKGLALEEDWRSRKWKHDLTFRALLILKYAGML